MHNEYDANRQMAIAAIQRRHTIPYQNARAARVQRARRRQYLPTATFALVVAFVVLAAAGV